MKAYLSLGGNLGDRGYYLRTAICRLVASPGIGVEKISSIYETKAWGEVEQPDFWNLVLRLETVLKPVELLHRLQEIENELGRVRTKKWGPRTIDIDILLYDNIVCDSSELKVPHPLMEQRAFVMIPLKEIAPDLILPSGTKVKETLASDEVRRIESVLEQTIS